MNSQKVEWSRITLCLVSIPLLLGVLLLAWGLEQSAVAQQQPQLPFGGWPSPDEKVPTYMIGVESYDGINPGFYKAPSDNYRLGPVQEAEVFETERHLYKAPFHYKNATIDYWWEYSEKGVEIQAERGKITIIEDKPIVSVTVVGTACETPGYNIVEWWGDGEDPTSPRGQLMKRQRIGDLHGQHPQWLHAAFMKKRTFKSVEEANEFVEQVRRVVYSKSFGYTIPGSVMGGNYENTAYFRIGDATLFAEGPSSRTGVHRKAEGKVEARKVVIRAGSMDVEEPGRKGGIQEKAHAYYPGDYAVRLIELEVKK